ncbi:peptidase S9 family [Actinomyces denticolens]|nr:peptidase S9 family [Actinomyces denticolens]
MEHAGPEDELPPLIVQVHGGPSAMSRSVYDLKVQYWTSRGFAYLEVNYRGSTGYGRAFRRALNGAWGVGEVEDVVAGARHLIEAGRVDGSRVAVRGSSAGGFTVLSAITRSDVFSAATSLYGVADLRMLIQETHKFESHYVQELIGADGIDDPLLAERSPINHVDSIHAPLLLLQGSNDSIVPADQATSMFEAARAKGLPVALEVFQGEGHGFRLGANIRKALADELSFYSQVWGIARDDEATPIAVENLAPRGE